MKISTTVLVASWCLASTTPVLGFQPQSGPTPPSTRSTTSILLTQLHQAASSSSSIEDRRAFLLSTSATAAAAFASSFSLLSSTPAHAAATTTVDYKAVAADISDMVRAAPDKGPTLVRLAWHSSGTYDKMSKTGGSGAGTLRFREELAHGGNAGLADTAVQWMEPLQRKYKDAGLSYADLYTLGGVAAIRTMGGPTIPWSAGRVDAMDPAISVTPDGRLPNADSGPKGADPADADHLRTIFNRMGFNDQARERQGGGADRGGNFLYQSFGVRLTEILLFHFSVSRKLCVCPVPTRSDDAIRECRFSVVPLQACLLIQYDFKTVR